MKPGPYLFVGGVLDGQWIETDGRRSWNVPVMPPLGERIGGAPFEELTMRYDEYSAQRWSCGGPDPANDRLIYLLSGGKTNLLDALLHGYRPGVAIPCDMERVDFRRADGIFDRDGISACVRHIEKGGYLKGTFILPPKTNV